MLGAIIGNIAGSVYEWDNIKTKDFPLFSERWSFFTNDTVMTIAVAEALLNGGTSDDFIDAMKKYGRLYPNYGYGVRFYDWLHSEDREPYNSWGNGSAMRVSPCAWFASSREVAEALAERSATVTHNHPEGIKGAQATAAAIYLARSGKTKDEIKEYIEHKYGYNLDRTLADIRPTYTFNLSCQETVPEAIIAFLESYDFEDAIRNAISLGGDSDTIAAITGSIAEAYYGIPSEITGKSFFFLDDTLSSVISRWLENGYPTRAVITKSDWKTEEFSKPHSIHVHLGVFEKMFCRIHFGLLPEAMEDKWFGYYEDGSLCFHHSWTGHKIYEAKIERDDSEWGYCITELIVERDSERHSCTNDDEDYSIFKYLLIRGLLGLDSSLPFKTDTDDGIKKARNIFGRMFLPENDPIESTITVREDKSGEYYPDDKADDADLQRLTLKLIQMLGFLEREDEPDDVQRDEALDRLEFLVSEAKEDAIVYHYLKFVLSYLHTDYDEALSHVGVYLDRYIREYGSVPYKMAELSFYTVFYGIDQKDKETSEYDDFLKQFHSILKKFSPGSAFELDVLSKTLDWDDPSREKILHEVLGKDLHWAGAYADLGHIYFWSESDNDRKEAIENYEHAIHLIDDLQMSDTENNPVFFNYIFVYLNLGQAYVKLKEYEKAIDYYNKGLELGGRDERAFAYSLLGNAYFESGDYAKAEVAYCECVALNPYYSDAFTNMSIILERQGRYDESIHWYQEAILEAVYHEKEEWEKVIENYENAIRISGIEKTDEILSSIGDAYFELEEYAKAEEAYRECIAQNPYYPESAINLGICLECQGNNGEALIWYKKAIECSGDDDERALAYKYLGNAYFELEDYAKAETPYQDCLSLTPSDPDVNLHLGLCFSFQGKYDEAISCFEKVIELSTDDDERALAYKHLGDTYLDLENYAKAEISYQACLSLTPSDPDATLHLGLSLELKEKYDEAIRFSEEGIELSTDDEECNFAYKHLGDAYLDLKEYRIAEISHQDCLTLPPSDPDANHHLGLCLELKEKYDEAISFFEKGIELSTDDEERAFKYAALALTPPQVCEKTSDFLDAYDDDEPDSKTKDSFITECAALISSAYHGGFGYATIEKLAMKLLHYVALIEKQSVHEHDTHPEIEMEDELYHYLKFVHSYLNGNYETALSHIESYLDGYFSEHDTISYKIAKNSFLNLFHPIYSSGNDIESNKHAAFLNTFHALIKTYSEGSAFELHILRMTLDQDNPSHEKILYEIIEKDENWADAYISLAQIYDEKEEWENVIKNYETAMRLSYDERQDEWFHNIGIAYFNVGEYAKAEVAFRICLDLDPPYVHILLGDCLARQGKYAEAMPYLKSGIESELDQECVFACESLVYVIEHCDADEERAFAYTLLGDCHYIQEKWTETIEQYETAMRLSDQQKTTKNFFNLGSAYEKVEDYAKAEAAYRECLSLDPSYPDANVKLGICLQKQGK